MLLSAKEINDIVSVVDNDTKEESYEVQTTDGRELWLGGTDHVNMEDPASWMQRIDVRDGVNKKTGITFQYAVITKDKTKKSILKK
jgi:hypothetical protein